MIDGSKPSVLIVDDTEANLVALEALLADLGCDIVRARSGNEALRQLLRREFALMLLDVQMPEMDGFEVARLARDNPATREVPIIFLTAQHTTEENVLHGYGTGAVDFLAKPIDPTVLRSKVRVFLELNAARQRLANAMAELERARAAAERTSRFKSQFLANISHELRTPLNAIIGFAELMQLEEITGPLAQKQREYVGHIVASGRHLASLVTDLLDLSRIEAGRIDLRKERVAIGEVLESARAIVRPLALEMGVKLEAELPAALPDVTADPTRLKQVLYNLLSNGIKFTPRGGVVKLQAQASGDRVHIAVADTGIGIRAEDQKRLFQEFERIEPVSGPRREGTGLGLALSKRLVELHGGEITLASEPGKGSTFTVSLPLGNTTSPSAEGLHAAKS